MNRGTVTGTSRSGSYFGMLYNNATATIKNCYVTEDCFALSNVVKSNIIGFAKVTINGVLQDTGDNGVATSTAVGVEEVSKDNLFADAQVATPKLDWTTPYWVVGTDSLPALKQIEWK